MNFTLDTKAPVISESLFQDTGSSATDKITSNGTIKGSGDPNATVQLTIDKTTTVTTTAGSDGSWVYLPSGLTDGSHTIVASETDGAGFTGTASLTYTLDATAPNVTENLVQDTGSSASDRITSKAAISGSGDAKAIVHLTIDGATNATVTAGATGAWTYTPTGLSDGLHTIVASETDVAGNTGTMSLPITLDTTAPPISVSDAYQTSTTNNGVTTLATVIKGHADPSGTPVTLYDTQGGTTSTLSTAITPNSNGDWTYTTNSLVSALHTFTASETDLAGNSKTSNKALMGTTGSDTLSDKSAGAVFSGNGGVTSADKLTGGGGNDVFVFHPNFGQTTVTNFVPGTGSSAHDLLSFDHNIPGLSGSTSDSQLASYIMSHTSDTKAGAVIGVDANDSILLSNIKTAQLKTDDFHLV